MWLQWQVPEPASAKLVPGIGRNSNSYEPGLRVSFRTPQARSFASPVTYQTHLIVYGPGGYRFTDFVRVGLPLDLACGVVALLVVFAVAPVTAPSLGGHRR